MLPLSLTLTPRTCVVARSARSCRSRLPAARRGVDIADRSISVKLVGVPPRCAAAARAGQRSGCNREGRSHAVPPESGSPTAMPARGDATSSLTVMEGGAVTVGASFTPTNKPFAGTAPLVALWISRTWKLKNRVLCVPARWVVAGRAERDRA